MSAPVLIPLLRRVMPSIMAADNIVGVSPSSGTPFAPPPSRIPWKLFDFDRPLPVAPGIYRHFLRLNNRRRTQGPRDLDAAGYAYVGAVPWRDWTAADAWCGDQLGPHAWLRAGGPGQGRWWFADDDTAAAFAMVWRAI